MFTFVVLKKQARSRGTLYSVLDFAVNSQKPHRKLYPQIVKGDGSGLL